MNNVDEAHEKAMKAIDALLDELSPADQEELLGRLVDDLGIKLEAFDE